MKAEIFNLLNHIGFAIFGMSFILVIIGLLPHGDNAWMITEVNRPLIYYSTFGTSTFVGIILIFLRTKENNIT